MTPVQERFTERRDDDGDARMKHRGLARGHERAGCIACGNERARQRQPRQQAAAAGVEQRSQKHNGFSRAAFSDQALGIADGIVVRKQACICRC